MSKTFRHLYQEALKSAPGEKNPRMHFAAHSHHPWPDVTLEAQIQYWKDSAEMLDQKWSYISREIFPRAKQNIASALGITNPGQITLAPNTHEFVTRLFSCLDFSKPVKILTTDSEFYSFARQARRFAELPNVTIDRVPALPAETFTARFSEAAAKNYDMIFFSHVFFNSGIVVKDLDAIVSGAAAESIIVVDGYHAFFALPIQLSSDLQNRIFYLGGGYKYAQSGEGACFLYVPPNCQLRPVNTGWFAEFDELETSRTEGEVKYAEGGSRFAGATFDPSGFYRFNTVCEMYKQQNLTVEKVHHFVIDLRTDFLRRWQEVTPFGITVDHFINLQEEAHFLTLKTTRAAELHKQLMTHQIWTDVRGDRLRFGFGLYQDSQTLDQLFNRIKGIQI